MADARALYREGFEHFTNQRFDAAAERYRRALEADPELGIAWNALAMALDRTGDVDGAIEAIERYIELDPDDPLGHTSLSIFFQKKGMIREAEDEKALATRLQTKQQTGTP
ncbi:MAG: tetratricopeptide repeat protein [Deltaproteobacteria bacterium]|nr:MAG: tetratricopeptide repeat protein [Deltaproteobacteria bacterium]